MLRKLRTLFGSKFYIKIFSSFTCILLLFLAVQLVLSNTYYSNLLEDDLRRMLSQQMNSVQMSIDKELLSLEERSQQILWSTKVDRARASSRLERAVYTESLYSLMSYLIDIRQGQSVQMDIWLYFPNNGVVISHQGNCTADFFFENYYVGGAPFPRGDLLAEPSLDLRPIGSYELRFNDTPSRGLAFVRPLTSGRPLSSAGYLFINLGFDTFDRLFYSSEPDLPMHAYVLDGNDNIVYSYRSAGEADVPESELTALSGRLQTAGVTREIERQMVGNREFLLSYNLESASGLRYILLAPQSYVSEMTLRQNVIALAAAVGCLLAGCVLSLVFARRIYLPIERIVDKLADTPPPELSAAAEGELGFISRSIDYYRNRNDDLQDFYLRAYLTLTETFFRDLLRGDADGGDSLTELLKIRLAYPYYQIILLRPRGLPRDKTMREAFPLLCMDMGEFLAEESLAGSAVYVSHVDDDTLLCLLNLREDSPVFADLDIFLEVLAEYERSALKLSFSTVVACLCRGKRELPSACLDAMRVLDEYAPITEGILYVDELRDSPGREPLYSIQQEKSLLNNIRAGNVTETESQLDELLSACQLDGAAAHSDKLFQQLVGTAYRASEQPGNGAGKETEELTRDLAADIAGLHPREKAALLRDVLRRLAERNEREKSDRKSAVYQRIRELIERNYDKELSLSSIGQQLGYSPSYISWVFKEASNTNYIDYLHEYRIAQAKLLLDGTELPILEIAGQIGYSNANTFIKRFKKQEGITPGQYRTSARQVSIIPHTPPSGGGGG